MAKLETKIREFDKETSDLLVLAIKDSSEKLLQLVTEKPQNFKSEKDIKSLFLKLLVGSFEDHI